MGRRPGQSDDYGRGRKRVTEEPEEIDDRDSDVERDRFQPFTSKEIPDDNYRNEVNQFLSLAKHQSSKGIFYLYRVIKGGKRALIHKTRDIGELPDENEIGIRYGSGDFEILMTAPNPKIGEKNIVVSHMVTIDQSYDELRRQNSPVQQQDSGKNLNEALALIQGIMATLIPLIRPAENSETSTRKLFDDMYAFQGKMMQRSVENSLQLITEYQRKMTMLKAPVADAGKPVEEDEGDDTNNFGNIIAQIMPYIKEFLPKILSHGPEGKIYSDLVKKTEMFKEISKNKKMVDALVNHLDATQGEDTTTKLLNSLGVKRLKVITPSKE